MKTNYTKLWLIGLGVAGVTALGAWAGSVDEEKVTIDKIPGAAAGTIVKEAAGAGITEIERTTKDGVTVYEAEFLSNGKEVEVTVAADGALLGREVEDSDNENSGIAFDQLPESARTAIQRLAAGATILKAELENDDGTPVYEATWSRNAAEHEATVTAAGALVETAEVVPVAGAPSAVRAAIVKHYGANSTVVVERKMIVVYEAEAVVDGIKREMLVLPTGKVREDQGDDDNDSDNRDDSAGDSGDDDSADGD